LTGVTVERQQVTLWGPDVPKDNFRDFGAVKSRDFKI